MSLIVGAAIIILWILPLIGAFFAGIYVADELPYYFQKRSEDKIKTEINKITDIRIAKFHIALDGYKRKMIEFNKLLKEYEKQRIENENRVKQELYDFWISLSGLEFENELAKLYQRLRYQVELTPYSGDGGADIILKKENEMIIVRCKAHLKPVGARVIRELYGTIHHYNADRAIIVSTGGFTRSVYKFIIDKPIQLLSIMDIINLARKI